MDGVVVFGLARLLEEVSQNIYCISSVIKYIINAVSQNIKGEEAKTRPPETLKCSKSKPCIARKLKLHQHVYLIR